MNDALYRKIARFTDLSSADRARLDAAPSRIVERRAGEDLIVQGDRPRHVHLLLRGWACRYKLLPDGGRQILAYLIPGDLCDVNVFILAHMDHAIGLLSDARVALIEADAMRDLLDTRPRIARALRWATSVDEAVLREWLVNVAQRGPYERIAHLFCELWLRLDTVGLVRDGRFALPVTQTELGDTVGLTPVTVNRVLQRLRADGLITLRDGELAILDLDRLKQVSGFNDTYLHLDRRVPARSR